MLTQPISREQRMLVLQQPLNQQFILHFNNANGGLVLIHKLVDPNDSDFELLVAIGMVLANEGKKVELLPKLHERDIDYRNKVLPGVRQNKNPDLRIDGEYWEVESPDWPYTKKKIENRIRKGQEQADSLIVFFSKPINVSSIERIIEARFKLHRNFNKAEIWVNQKRISSCIK